MGGELKLKICGTCRDYIGATETSGNCDLADQPVFARDVRSCWTSRKGNVLGTIAVVVMVALGIGALLAAIWSAAVAGR
jgi:hypothetical protein